VRSPVAHPGLRDRRRGRPGLAGGVAVLTAADLDDIPPGSDEPTSEPLLATRPVRYVGESVALVLTEHGSQGEDAAELVSVGL